jgi:predicted SAM-dependent methyltransferase
VFAQVRRFVKTRLSSGLRRALRDVQLELRIQRLHNIGVRRAKRLATGRPLRLNLGSGLRPRAGWVNVDLSEQSDLPLDLRRPLPFGDGVADAIYSEHFFEHLSYPNLDDPTAWHHETTTRPSEALSFLRECWRVLGPGGSFDIVVPDAEQIIQEYAGRHRRPFPIDSWWGPKWCDTPLHCVNYVFRQGRQHQYAYDEETLGRVLENVGFVNVRRRAFNPLTDAENHAIGSLCMQASKPYVSTEGAAGPPTRSAAADGDFERVVATRAGARRA